MPGPSPFVLHLIPSEGHTKRIECPRTIQTLDGAKKHARQWAGDVGVKGSILVSDGPKDVACGLVVNSILTRWI